MTKIGFYYRALDALTEGFDWFDNNIIEPIDKLYMGKEVDAEYYFPSRENAQMFLHLCKTMSLSSKICGRKVTVFCISRRQSKFLKRMAENKELFGQLKIV